MARPIHQPSSSPLAAIFIAVVVVAAVVDRIEAASCPSTYLVKITDCLSYLTGGQPTSTCCNSMKSLYSSSTASSSVKATMCGCISYVGAVYSRVNWAFVANLLETCGVAPTGSCP
ncbi:hypothetical protein M569_10425 [Genlisea aurea]|uniref:Bifunctional inhibitor/plant lipid transfer protein/seed storage helical domain-containing protein n=1 Tax=Genlisea aurea TaxID=192259 RepID=S8CI84_9LAMI|nr:hypothetical protein M569_10425 [Genlisea aurea]